MYNSSFLYILYQDTDKNLILFFDFDRININKGDVLDLLKEDDLSINSTLLNKGVANNVDKSFADLEKQVYRRLNRLSKTSSKAYLALSMILYILVNPIVFLSTMQENETYTLKEVQK